MAVQSKDKGCHHRDARCLAAAPGTLARKQAIGCRNHSRTTHSAGRGSVIGSACRWTSFQVPSSGRKTLVTRRATGVTSSLPPTFASNRSIPGMYARSAVTHLATSWNSMALPSR